ncbi:superoxide dismutase [candidate division KSB1 bacterium]|nr:superoxide dismutase [candidate division KSB1 bacterium]
MNFKTPELPYAYDALEPYIDVKTMELHHDKHHVAYTTKLNEALKSVNFKASSVEELLADLNSLPESIRSAVLNHGGGHVNHALFWEIMGPHAGGEPDGELEKTISAKFGSFKAFKEQFSNLATSRFGSGWAWLSVKKGGLVLSSTANQDSPIREGAVPILGLDVWEHAYYLKYNNRRSDYVEAWWNVVNWSAVQEKYKAAAKLIR